MHAINFLTAVSRSVHYKLFEGADTLRQICESIVIPNLRMREDMVRGCACCAALRGRWVCLAAQPCRAAGPLMLAACRTPLQLHAATFRLYMLPPSPCTLVAHPSQPAGGDV